MLFEIQLVFIICGNYIRLVETLSKFLDIKNVKERKQFLSFFCVKTMSKTRLKRTFMV